jgi:hypothetical protein
MFSFLLVLGSASLLINYYKILGQRSEGRGETKLINFNNLKK